MCKKCIGRKSSFTTCAVKQNGIASLILFNFSQANDNKPSKQISYIGFNLNITNITIYFSKRRKHVIK
jgi:hypothetical protein